METFIIILFVWGAAGFLFMIGANGSGEPDKPLDKVFYIIPFGPIVIIMTLIMLFTHGLKKLRKNKS